MIGGVLRESTELLVPQAFRSSKSYSIFVTQNLNFMAENIGGVEAKEPADDEEENVTQVEGYVARKTVGNFIDLAGLATFHISPLTVLAIVSDVAYGSQVYLKELADELKEQGVIDKDSTIDKAADLLDAVSDASGVTASAFDMPPMSVDGLKETLNQTAGAVKTIDPTKVLPQSEIKRMWDEINDVAKKEDLSMLEVSGAMSMFTIGRIGSVGKGALSTVKVAGNLFDRHIFDHYSDSLKDINEKGIYRSLADSSGPYIDAVWYNFHSDRSTITEDVLSGKLIGRAWTGMVNWMSPKVDKDDSKGDDEQVDDEQVDDEPVS